MPPNKTLQRTSSPVTPFAYAKAAPGQAAAELKRQASVSDDPTIFRERGYRFFFFSLEESWAHVHVRSPDGEAKFWLEPRIELAKNQRLSGTQLRQIQSIVEAHADELIAAWKAHFRDSGH